jgi:hypothetical protein
MLQEPADKQQPAGSVHNNIVWLCTARSTSSVNVRSTNKYQHHASAIVGKNGAHQRSAMSHLGCDWTPRYEIMYEQQGAAASFGV